MVHLDRVQSALLALLRAGLWGILDTESVFPLSAREWEQVFDLARRQTVTGIVFRGLGRLPDKDMPPVGLMAKWMAYVGVIERQNSKMNALLKRLAGHLEARGVAAVLQKGQGVAMMYPEPLLRECGDIDLYFPDMKDVAAVEEFVGAAGKNMPDGSVEFVADGIVIECHGRLVDIYAPSKKRYVHSLIETVGYEKVPVGTGEDGAVVYVPGPEINLLMLSAHIMKHAVGVGIGLRQLCDFAVACRHYGERVEAERMREIYEKAGIGKWAELLDAFLAGWIYDDGCGNSGTETPPKAKKSGILLEIILKGGNFGAFTEGRENASGSVAVRKWSTFTTYLGKLRFAWPCAPREWFWMMMRLFRGQFE